MMNGQHELDVWKFVAPEFVFGPGTRYLAGLYARNLGLRKALVVTDPGVIAMGWTEHVIASLEREGVSCSVFSQVTPNPRAEEVTAGAELYEHESCNGIVAVGGGSPMDCAKAIGIVSTNKRHILVFEGVDEIPLPGPPLICIPTTAGSSAVVSQFAVITDRQQSNKIDIVSKTLVPDVSLIDPLTKTTMLSSLTAWTGFDALSHAIEAFASTAHSPITDLHALEAIRLVSQRLPHVLKDPTRIELRSKQMLGSLNAGLAFSNASLGLAHAMSHSLGGLTDIAHGECNSILLGPVIALNFDPSLGKTAERYQLIGEAMGLDLHGMPNSDQRSALIGEVNRLRKVAGPERTLGEVGVRNSDIPELARKAMRDPCIVTNPRMPSQRDIEVLFEEAL